MLAASSAFAVNGNIGIFGDTGLAGCQATLPCDSSATLYVYGILAGASRHGFTVAEFGIKRSAAAGWFVGEISVAGPIITLGNAMLDPNSGVGGINLAYASCESGQSDPDSYRGTAVLLRKLLVHNFCPSG